jgi:DNA-binding NarL/FixJ family response regulator
VSGVRRLRILVVDDHEVVNWGFRVLLTRQPWVERCVTATSQEQALAYTRRYEPHVALVDLFLDDDSGVDVARAIREVSATTRVLLVSGARTAPAKAVRAAGAAGYVSKSWSPDEMAAAVRLVGLGLNLALTVPEVESPPATRLSGRERDVLELIATGKRNADIASELCLSVYTVKQHASAAYQKLGVRNRVEAVRRAERLGYLTSV